LSRVALAGAAVVALACDVAAPLRPSLKDAPTHARYTEALEDFGLEHVALGRDWLQAASKALENPRAASLPFSESGYFPPDRPSAVAYRLDLRRGRRLAVDVMFESAEPARLFVDLFELRDGEAPRRIAGPENGATRFEHDVRRDGAYVLRLQPELLRGGRYTVTQRTLASLASPIKGFQVSHVRSGFGDPRDAGARDHHGVDIFAARGTPVLASVNGIVFTDETPRGGRVVWLRDARTSRNVYYAHLNDWAVTTGTEVRTGDVIGYVGNTGNARTTPPHLHFGVYDRGPADPVPFLQRDDPAPRPITASTGRLGQWMRVATSSARLAPHAPAEKPATALLTPGSVVRVTAATGAHYHVELPDGRSGLVRASDVIPTDAPRMSARVTGDVFEAPNATAPVVEVFQKPRALPVLGHFGDFALVRLSDDRVGWTVRKPG
jgi:murein DD-endopeptidase MepM/ murein hydrolase activator NlpD